MAQHIPPSSKEELEARWAESLERKFLKLPVLNRVSRGTSALEIVGEKVKISPGARIGTQEEASSCRPVHGSDSSLISRNLSESMEGSFFENVDETGESTSKPREGILEAQLIDLGLGIPNIVDIDGPTKKKVDAEMATAVFRGTSSEKITESSSGGSGATPRRPIIILQQRVSPPQAQRCSTPQRSAARTGNQQPASPGNRSHASQIYHYTYEEDLRSPPSPVPPFVVVSNSGVARVSLRHSMDYEPDQRTILEETTQANRAFRRKASIFCLAAVLALAVITLVSGIVGNLEDRGRDEESISDLSPFGAPGTQNTAAPVSAFTPQPTARPAMNFPDSNGNSNFLDVGDGVTPREETLAPTASDNVRPTRPPRTRPPSESPVVLVDSNATELDFPLDSYSLAPSSATSGTPSELPTGSDLTAYLVALIGSESPDSIMSILHDPMSISQTAFDWIVEDQLEMVSLLPDDRLLQRFALACFYYATGGPNWDVRTSWLSSENECEWYMTTPQYICDSNGAIIVIHLEENGVSGNIPPEISLLSTLQRITLPENEISGSLPTVLGNMATLELVELDNNILTGSIPTEIGNLLNLGVLGLGGNNIDGTIPTEIGNLGNLDTLRLSKNSLSGKIPVELGSMHALRFAFLCSNLLSGEVPSIAGTLQHLEQMKLTGNDFSGAMPKQICNLRFGVLSQLTVDCDEVICSTACCTGCNIDEVGGAGC